jgi:hypothetical protein
VAILFVVVVGDNSHKNSIGLYSGQFKIILLD